MREKRIRASFRLAILVLCAGALPVLAQSVKSAETGAKADNILTLNDQADTYSKSEQYEQAIELLKRAVRLAPESAPILRNLGVVYLNAGQSQLAIEALEQSLRLKPNEAETYLSHQKLQNSETCKHRKAPKINFAEQFCKLLKIGGETSRFPS